MLLPMLLAMMERTQVNIQMVIDILPGLEHMHSSPSNVRHELTTLVTNGPLLGENHQEEAEELVK